jgi:hypothetical protein
MKNAVMGDHGGKSFLWVFSGFAEFSGVSDFCAVVSVFAMTATTLKEPLNINYCYEQNQPHQKGEADAVYQFFFFLRQGLFDAMREQR